MFHDFSGSRISRNWSARTSFSIWWAPDGHHISKSQSSGGDWDGNSRVGALKTAILIQRQQRRLQIMQGLVDGLDIVQYVALGHEQILPAVVVEVLQANAPARAACG